MRQTSTPTPPARAESSPSIPPPFTSQTSYTRHEERSVADSYGAASPPVSQPVSAIPAPPASLVPEAFVQPPGQTVDDLLNSILGVAAPPKPPQHANLPINGPSAPPTGPKASISPPMPEPHPLTSTRIGNASFAQAAGATSPIPPTTRPNLVQTASASSFGLNDQAARQSPRPFPAQAPPQHQQRNTFTPPPISNGFVPPLGHNGPPILPHTGSGPGGPRQVPHNVKGQIAQSVVEAVSARNGDEGVRRPEEVNEVGRRMFIQDLLHLIHVSSTSMRHRGRLELMCRRITRLWRKCGEDIWPELGRGDETGDRIAARGVCGLYPADRRVCVDSCTAVVMPV